MPAITRPTSTYYQERGLDGSSPREAFGVGQNTATRLVWCAWADRFKIARAILGYSKLERDGGGAVTGLRRLTPLPHPDAQVAGSDLGPGNMWATRLDSISGWKPTAGVAYPLTAEAALSTGPKTAKRNQFTRAIFSVQYENPGYQVREESEMVAPGPVWPDGEYIRFLKVLQPTPAANYITMPGGTLKYAKNGGGGPTGKPIGFNAGKVFPTQQFKFLWKRLPWDLFDITSQSNWAKRIFGDPADPAAIPLIGTVNDATFLGFPAGTLLLENVVPIPVESPFYFVYEWDFEIQLHFDPNGWNRKYYFPASAALAGDRGHYYVSATSTYYAPGAVPDNDSIYNERDHSLIFNVKDTP